MGVAIQTEGGNTNFTSGLVKNVRIGLIL